MNGFSEANLAQQFADGSSIYEGDAQSVLSGFPDNAFQCVVTSPPYWGLRDYQIDGQIGLEDSLPLFISNLVKVFRQVHRVLREDGVLWLNIGDGFTSGNRGYRAPDKKNRHRAMSVRPPTPDGLKPKDMLGIPWRLAFALQDAGWYLRSDIVWHKPNAMPESVRDRPTRCHEYLFMLTKADKYFYDHDAVKENAANGKKRNRRSVWALNTQASKWAHAAPFPTGLVRPCILAATRPGDLVLDPFSGSGTVGEVARSLGRPYTGVELNPEYVELSIRRLSNMSPIPLSLQTS